MVVLKCHGAHRSIVRQHRWVASFGSLARAIPNTSIAAAAGREPVRGVVEGEKLNLALVTAHVELDVLRRNPKMHARILVSGYKPPIIRRPDERLNAIAVDELLLQHEIISVPQRDSAEKRR